MFGLLNSSQIYGLQHEHEHNSSSTTPTSTTSSAIKKTSSKHRRSSSSLSDTVKENKFFASLSSMQGIKSPTNFIEKFIKTELLNGYDTIKNYKNFQQSASTSSTSTNSSASKQSTSGHNLHPEGILTSFNCLQGSYRSNCDGEFYEVVNVNSQRPKNATTATAAKTSEMTVKCSKNLLAEPAQTQAPATLQNYQKLPEDCDHDLPPEMAAAASASSGASSGEFNSDTTNGHTSSSNSLYKKLSFGGRGSKQLNVVEAQSNEVASDNSSSSITTTTTNSSVNNSCSSANTSNKSNDLQRTSSASSSGDCVTAKEHKKTSESASTMQTSNSPATLTPERAQRRKLLQMISNYDQQNKQLQRELAKEKRRRSEELACVVKSLLCFEAKLKTDMKTVNQRLQEKDVEICRLVRQNRALRKRVNQLQKLEQEGARDEGVVEDGEAELLDEEQQRGECDDKDELMADCLVLEALQCINCRMQFYDIDLKEGWTQTGAKDGSRNNDGHTMEHGSSSDDTTVSSSFYGARRSVRYTSKRTAGNFRDYMRSRSMNIDDPTLDNNSEENTSTIRSDDSQTSYEKLNMYSRTIERMHGVKCESERESEHSGVESARGGSRMSSKCSEKSVSSQIEEDDGIFSPTQDDDFEEEPLEGVSGMAVRRAGLGEENSLKIVQRRSMDFSEASPKQVYETSTDDWYASASDQEEIGSTAAKSYGHGAVNPVLECVNQILLQQSMEEPLHESANTPELLKSNEALQQQQLTPKTPTHLQLPASLPRRSSLSGRRSSRSNSHSSDGQTSRNGTLTRKRVHFSTKNSMVHVPRNDDDDDEQAHDVDDSVQTLEGNAKMISTLQQHYYPMNYCPPTLQDANATGADTHVRLDTLNYESIYSNEYEPIGSEHNAYNLYVDMESSGKLTAHIHSPHATAVTGKMTKMPPALPPKPANLLKFKKSLQQLDEVPDEHLQQDCDMSMTTAASEPDYCSISEVNVRITSVQIKADVHKAPPPTESELDDASQCDDTHPLELQLEISTVSSDDDDICAASQKTDEIEEIFADIPKLPNVAAIIAPKTAKYDSQADYLVMTPKVETSSAAHNDFLSTPNNSKPTKVESTPLKLQLQLHAGGAQQYKRKHMPNILAEINKRMSQPNSPTTPTKLSPSTANKLKPLHSPNTLLQQLESITPNLPLQAEFDWYNLDAEYGRAPAPHNTVESLSGSGKVLEEIHEDHECVSMSTADEYNLDEEFSLSCEKADELEAEMVHRTNAKNANRNAANARLNAAICEAVNFPLLNEHSPLMLPPAGNTKAKKIKKNLANFEKFIEGSGLSSKPLPSKRKIYFAGPFV